MQAGHLAGPLTEKPRPLGRPIWPGWDPRGPGHGAGQAGGGRPGACVCDAAMAGDAGGSTAARRGNGGAGGGLNGGGAHLEVVELVGDGGESRSATRWCSTPLGRSDRGTEAGADLDDPGPISCAGRKKRTWRTSPWLSIRAGRS